MARSSRSSSSTATAPTSRDRCPRLPLLVQEDREAIFAFSVGAVPAAVVVDQRGRVASETVMVPMRWKGSC